MFPYIALFRLVSEASTVFINIRWLLLTLKMKETQLYFYNGVMLVTVFALVRIVTIVPNWMIFYSLMDTPAWNSVDFKHKLVCVVTSSPLDVLNLFWFGKIVRILLKHQRSNPAECKLGGGDDEFSHLMEDKLFVEKQD